MTRDEKIKYCIECVNILKDYEYVKWDIMEDYQIDEWVVFFKQKVKDGEFKNVIPFEKKSKTISDLRKQLAIKTVPGNSLLDLYRRGK